MSPHYKLPLSIHADLPHIVVDAEGTVIAQCGRNGDSVQAGGAIAADLVTMFNTGQWLVAATVDEAVASASEAVSDAAAAKTDASDATSPASSAIMARPRVTSMSNRKTEE